MKRTPFENPEHRREARAAEIDSMSEKDREILCERLIDLIDKENDVYSSEKAHPLISTAEAQLLEDEGYETVAEAARSLGMVRSDDEPIH